jgi:hypothetical protein
MYKECENSIFIVSSTYIHWVLLDSNCVLFLFWGIIFILTVVKQVTPWLPPNGPHMECVGKRVMRGDEPCVCPQVERYYNWCKTKWGELGEEGQG